MLLTALILVVGLGFELTPTMQIVLGLVFVQGIGCAGVAMAYVRLRPRVAPFLRGLLGIDGSARSFRLGASVPDLRDLLVVVGGYGLAIAALIVGSIVVSLLQVDTGTNQAAEIGLENPELLLILIPASLLVIGPGEELLFRGVVQGRLREVFGPVPGVVIPSAVFAALHWFALTGGSLTGNLVVLAVLFGPALVFGASYEYTGNVVVPSLIHGAYNATLFSLLYVTIAFGDKFPDAATLLVATSG